MPARAVVAAPPPPRVRRSFAVPRAALGSAGHRRGRL